MKKAKIYYHDIGDYLTREEKLKIVKKFGSFANMPLTELTPNEHGDWISLRNDAFENYIPLAPEKKFDTRTQSVFNVNVVGVATNRDAWVNNFSKEKVSENMKRFIEFYNEQKDAFSETKQKNPKLEVDNFIDTNATKISWTVNLKKDLEKNKTHDFKTNEIKIGYYRPFTKQHLYFDKPFIERAGLSSQLFPTKITENIQICITGVGGTKDFSAIATNCITDLQVQFNGQIFPLYYYEENNAVQKSLFDDTSTDSASGDYIRRDAISDFILERAKKQYGISASSTTALTKEDIFYYVYGFLHSKEYRETFANDLKKMLPRLPLVENVKDFWAFSNAGRHLAALHLNYESIEPSKEAVVLFNPLNTADTLKQANKTEIEYLNYRVEKMRFPKKSSLEGGKDGVKGTIIYNSQITIDNIPEKAYEYVVNGKSAIEWIMERYAVTTHKESGITNNPNDWAKETGNPRYILDLLLSVINVSVQTVDIVEGLPKVKFE